LVFLEPLCASFLPFLGPFLPLLAFFKFVGETVVGDAVIGEAVIIGDTVGEYVDALGDAEGDDVVGLKVCPAANGDRLGATDGEVDGPLVLGDSLGVAEGDAVGIMVGDADGFVGDKVIPGGRSTGRVIFAVMSCTILAIEASGSCAAAL